MAGTNLTLRRRQLAAQLKKLRLDAGMTIEEVAKELLVHPTKISRMETGQRGVTARDVRDLAQIYGLEDNKLLNHLMALARDSRKQGLRQEFGDLGDNAIYTYMDIEAAASSITELQNDYLPGLLQLENYARSLIRGNLPQIEAEILERRVRARVKRQERLLEEPPPRYWTLINEAIFHRIIGGPETMAEQLAHIIRMAEAQRVIVQVIPFTAGAYMGMDSSFVLFELTGAAHSSIVYRESLRYVEYFEKPDELAVFKEAIDHGRAVALSPATSIEFMKDFRETYAT